MAGRHQTVKTDEVESELFQKMGAFNPVQGKSLLWSDLVLLR